MPSLGSAKLHKLHVRLENFTPDGRSLIGEVPEVRNYLLAAAVTPQLSGAAGKLITDIITKSENSFGHDYWSLDPRRFIPLHSMYTAICLMGPLSKLVLADVLSDAQQLDSFPFFTYKQLEIGLASNVRVCNLTHTGELGWVLYIPNEHALHVYDFLVRVGHKYGLRHAGSIAMRTLRIEKFFAFWGQDLDTTTTPLECGRSFRVKFDKDFLGRNALLKQKEEGVQRLQFK
jgi:glycine cleavage system aminomethyltransferase T